MFDAIVVGARCAGSPTAMLLARKGHRVLVVDRANFPSDVPSTHFVWPHGLSYLNRWGLLKQVLATTPSHTVLNVVQDGIELSGTVPLHLLREHFRELHGDDSGVVQRYASVRRRVLDKILLDAAADAGAQVRTGFVVEELIQDKGRVVGIRGKTQDGRSVEERARVVVGADGRNSSVARALGLRKHDVRHKCTFAYWGYYSGFTLPSAYMYQRGRLGVAAAPTNFGQNMLLVWGPRELAEEFRVDLAGNFEQALDLVSPELGKRVRAQGKREGRLFATLDQSAYLRPLFGQGWVLAGDAQCFKDQCTAIGMTHAFRDAELLAAGLDDWLSGDSAFDVALKHYESCLRGPAATAYYDYVCAQAEMRALDHDELQFLSGLRDDQQQTDHFIAMHGGIAIHSTR
ncbi:FAD-dependent monooxygenase [Allokutzneria sp. A3M-2-11 16]|uniref:NAD(P)/FAD-dependent oxidoreductase n=1 Tax=Allokutzneria sp. A3M-2-11 16 TaxID=2962043 RepID=UPI0020B7273B|nr:FAD-dependent monooxygenase [Allokutzneria sp. A3M-2-11 16]MCP3797689.1 FAD-dependent monooxygenase [Allokutzneria sp. A3M-2-11 16]